jgi:hypothetical protein
MARETEGCARKFDVDQGTEEAIPRLGRRSTVGIVKSTKPEMSHTAARVSGQKFLKSSITGYIQEAW